MESRNQGAPLIYEAMAYALAGMFLLAGLVKSSITLIVLGWVFIAFAAILIVAVIINKPFKWGGKFGWLSDWIKRLFASLLFIVTYVEFVVEAVKPERAERNLYIMIAVAFLLLLTFGIGFSVFRDRTKLPKIDMKPTKIGMECARLFGPVGITAGLATFFFGISGKNNNWVGYNTNIYSGIILIAIGFVLVGLYLLFLKSEDKK